VKAVASGHRDHSWNVALANIDTFTIGLIHVYGPCINKWKWNELLLSRWQCKTKPPLLKKTQDHESSWSSLFWSSPLKPFQDVWWNWSLDSCDLWPGLIMVQCWWWWLGNSGSCSESYYWVCIVTKGNTITWRQGRGGLVHNQRPNPPMQIRKIKTNATCKKTPYWQYVFVHYLHNSSLANFIARTFLFSAHGNHLLS